MKSKHEKKYLVITRSMNKTFEVSKIKGRFLSRRRSEHYIYTFISFIKITYLQFIIKKLRNENFLCIVFVVIRPSCDHGCIVVVVLNFQRKKIIIMIVFQRKCARRY